MKPPKTTTEFWVSSQSVDDLRGGVFSNVNRRLGLLDWSREMGECGLTFLLTELQVRNVLLFARFPPRILEKLDSSCCKTAQLPGKWAPFKF